jgi:hypothetical protein
VPALLDPARRHPLNHGYGRGVASLAEIDANDGRQGLGDAA